MPMISPSAVHAVTSRQAGSVARRAASEWVARERLRRGEPRKAALLMVEHLAGAAMHDLAGVHDLTPERQRHRLHPQAHPKHRQAGRDGRRVDRVLLGAPWPRGEQDAVRFGPVRGRRYVGAHHPHREAQNPRILHETTGKTVPVVDDQQL